MKTIGIVGHSDNIKRIQRVIEDNFANIKGTPIEIHDMRQIQTTVNYLKEHINDFDGIIYTGKILYDIMNHRMHSQNPWVHLDNDESQLQRIFLQATLNQGLDIRQVSIDSFTEEMVRSIYSDFGFESGQYYAKVSSIDIFHDNLIEALVEFHRSHHLAHLDSIAITGISMVHQELVASGVPSMLLVSNENAIKNKLHDLLRKIKFKDMSVSQIVVISMEIDPDNEYDLISENEYSVMLQKTQITEEVYKFAQRIQAAVVETEKSYMLFTTRQILEFETNNLRELPILGSIHQKTSHTISVGIGFGITAREAKSNAVIGKNKAFKMGGHQCFVVYDRKRLERITAFDKVDEKEPAVHELPFKEISEKSGVSINKIYQMKCLMDLYKKDTFTSLELAQEFGNSLRSMNRMIEKLEQAGYIEVVGRKIIGKAGRPSRILKVGI
ncbi:MAG: ArsR family transcriptional regulator [Clostridia bacterium]|nr:ArsR family transcriptional regulator [Clostridia bacterium]